MQTAFLRNRWIESLIFLKNDKIHTREHFKLANVLDLYKLNILSIAVFMHRVHTKTSPSLFTRSFQRIPHLNSTRSSPLNFSKSTKTKYMILIRGPAIRNLEVCAAIFLLMTFRGNGASWTLNSTESTLKNSFL